MPEIICLTFRIISVLAVVFWDSLHNSSKNSSIVSSFGASSDSSNRASAKLRTKMLRKFWRNGSRALISSFDLFPSSSSFSITVFKLSRRLLKMAFCSSYSVVGFRNFRNSDSRPVKDSDAVPSKAFKYVYTLRLIDSGRKGEPGVNSSKFIYNVLDHRDVTIRDTSGRIFLYRYSSLRNLHLFIFPFIFMLELTP